MIDELQRQTARAIVNIFETGRVLGDYASVTLIDGDTGHLTYGRSQTTLSSGNLFLLIKAYCEAGGAELAGALEPYLARLAARDTTLDHDATLRALFRQAGADPVMHDVQDSFFDRVYWQPASQQALRLGVSTALGTAVVYDSYVHGSFAAMRTRTDQARGTIATLGEQGWIPEYLATRRAWLVSKGKPLSNTVYRMDAFQALVRADGWRLDLPVQVLGHRIDALTLQVSSRVTAEEPELRILRLTAPPSEGADVLVLQQALNRHGGALEEDSVFGPETEAAVRQFQALHGLRPDAIVGPATRAALGFS